MINLEMGQLPNAENAYVTQEKIVDYLLCAAHPDGASKARFFQKIGFNSEAWLEFARSLKKQGQTNKVVAITESVYGTRYVIDGPIETPSGKKANIRTVWIIEVGESKPRLVTAHPLTEGNKND